MRVSAAAGVPPSSASSNAALVAELRRLQSLSSGSLLAKLPDGGQRIARRIAELHSLLHAAEQQPAPAPSTSPAGPAAVARGAESASQPRVIRVELDEAAAALATSRVRRVNGKRRDSGMATSAARASTHPARCGLFLAADRLSSPSLSLLSPVSVCRRPCGRSVVAVQLSF